MGSFILSMFILAIVGANAQTTPDTLHLSQKTSSAFNQVKIKSPEQTASSNEVSAATRTTRSALRSLAARGFRYIGTDKLEIVVAPQDIDVAYLPCIEVSECDQTHIRISAKYSGNFVTVDQVMARLVGSGLFALVFENRIYYTNQYVGQALVSSNAFENVVKNKIEIAARNAKASRPNLDWKTPQKIQIEFQDCGIWRGIPHILNIGSCAPTEAAITQGIEDTITDYPYIRADRGN